MSETRETALSKLRYVRQEDPMGCGVACVAMAASVPYSMARSLVWEENEHTSWMDIGRALHKLNYLTAWTFSHGEIWPLRPFAPLHILQFDSFPERKGVAHYVVWTHDERIYDPARPSVKTFYDLGKAAVAVHINHVGGVWGPEQ